MLDLIASFLVRGVNRVFHVMPIRFNLWLGRRAGGLLYRLSGKRRRITYSSLKAAFCGEKTPAEIKGITKGVYRQIAQTFAEILSMTKVDKRYIEKFVNVHNLERVDAASRNPRGMIFLSAHFGNWELSTVTGGIKGYPLYLLARDQKMRRLNELLNILRESKGSIVIRKGVDIRNIFRVLLKGKSVGMLADQNAGPNGVLLDFFGRPASTAAGPYRFAQESGAVILPAFIHRAKGPYHELFVEPPMYVEKGVDVSVYMREYDRLLEKHIRKDPDQWLWMHKRWKMTPVKSVMVLDDGKKGHLKQSLAVVEQIKRYRGDEGYAPEHLKIDVIKVTFRNKAARTVFSAMSPFFTPRCQGCMKCLRRALENESYDNAVNRYADVIVSCGSALSGVNSLLKMENYARNVSVLDPGYLNRGKFDLIVLPRHDVLRKKVKGENVVITELAPNLIRGDLVRAYAGDIHVPGGQRGMRGACIGLLFGGDNTYFHFGEDLARKVAEKVKEACDRIDGYACVTTSRRTPPGAEEALARVFAENPRCVKFVRGQVDQDEHTVEKILGAAEVIIVSGESISMVSEAVSSGKRVLVFMPEKKVSHGTKYEDFVRGLAERGYVKQVDVDDIALEAERAAGEICGKAGCRPDTVIPDDNERIYRKMHKLF
ncbi:MAG: ELM1/GtrOC1 family putative glycosyltransferase [Candidatus Omnitrophota bacterium]